MVKISKATINGTSIMGTALALVGIAGIETSSFWSTTFYILGFIFIIIALFAYLDKSAN